MAPAPSAGKALSGFLLSGFLFALLGAVLPAWGYHRDPPEFITIGNCFLSLAVGVIAAHQISAAILARKSLRFLLVCACVLGCARLISLALATPPVGWPWRVPGLAALGLAVGLLNAGLLQTIASCYTREPVRVAVMGGIYYGLGCLAATLLVAGTFYAYTVPMILLLMAVVPALLPAFMRVQPFRRRPPWPSRPAPSHSRFSQPGRGAVCAAALFPIRQRMVDCRMAAAVADPASGHEPAGCPGHAGSSTGWLLVGRLVARSPFCRRAPQPLAARERSGGAIRLHHAVLHQQWIRRRHGRALLLGAGYASVYPLVAEAIGRRFPYYHPGFFNGIFSFALVGGLLAPATLGYAASRLGRGRGGGDSAGRHLHGDGAASAHLAGIEGDGHDDGVPGHVVRWRRR